MRSIASTAIALASLVISLASAGCGPSETNIPAPDADSPPIVTISHLIGSAVPG